MHLGRLPFGGRLPHLAFDRDAATGREAADLAFVVFQLRVGDDLDIRLRRAVVQLQKAESALGIAARANPALQTNIAANRRRFTSRADAHSFHRRRLET